ncbi:MAG: hypothetical protein J6R44_02615 [Clostridia bacterium]|nr:hypothetical protein [Clostridia bacterium]
MQRENYPIPNFIRPRFKSLDGDWTVDLFCANESYSMAITLPCELGSNASNTGSISNVITAVYHKTFELNASEINGSVLLNFISVSSVATIYLNDVLVAQNYGSMHSLHFDVSQLVKDGENVLKVITSRENEMNLPLGILGDVWLEFSAKTYFGAIRTFGSLLDKNIYIQGALTGETEGYKVKVEIAYDKKPVATYEYRAKSVLNLSANLKTQTVYLWQALEPRFYEVRLSLFNANGGLCDQVYTYCAFRTLTLVDNRLYVNGQPTFVRAVEVDGVYAHTGLVASNAKAIAQDYASLMMMGFNAIHFNRYPTPRELYVADKLGIMVRASLQGENKNTDVPENFNTFATEAQMVITRDFGHPSLIMEIPFTNYNGSQVVQESTYKLIKQTDPYKLVSVSGGDLYSTDLYEFREDSGSKDEIEEWLIYRFNGVKLNEKEDMKRRKQKPALISEDALRAMPVYVGSITAGTLRPNDLYKEAQFITSYAEQLDLILSSGAISFTLSRLYDSVDNNNGLLTANRDFKISRDGIAKLRAINKKKAISEQ